MERALLSDSEVRSLFGGGSSAGITSSGRSYTTTFAYNGQIYTARMGSAKAVYALTYGLSTGAYSDTAMLCYFEGKCQGAFTSVDNIYTLADMVSSGFRLSLNVRNMSPTTNDSYRPEFSSQNLGSRGLTNVFAPSPVTAGACDYSTSGSGPTFTTDSEARAYAIKKLANAAVLWSEAGKSCLNFERYLFAMVSSGNAVTASLRKAQTNKENPLLYWTVDGISVVNDPAPTDTDGDGIPDTSDPTPNGPDTDGDGIPDTSDPTPNGPTTPTDPPADPDDPTRDVDYEADCNVINLFCWARWAFTPQVDWSAEWAELRQAFSARVPFGYTSWITQATASAGGYSITSFEFAGATIDYGNTPVMQWWMSTGRYLLFGVFAIGALMVVVRGGLN